MPWHQIVSQIIEIEQKEIALYQQIATGAPTPALRDMICAMVEHEQRELCWWQQFMQSGSVMPGYPPSGDYCPPGDGYQPGTDYYPPGGGYQPDADCPPGYCPPGYHQPPKGWTGTPYNVQEEGDKDEKE